MRQGTCRLTGGEGLHWAVVPLKKKKKKKKEKEKEEEEEEKEEEEKEEEEKEEEEAVLTSKLYLNLRKKPLKCCIWSGLVWC